MEGRTRWKLPGSFLGQCLMGWCSFPRATITKSHKLDGLGHQAFIVFVLEAGSLKSKCLCSVMHLLEALWNDLSQASFLASGSHRCSLTDR